MYVRTTGKALTLADVVRVLPRLRLVACGCCYQEYVVDTAQGLQGGMECPQCLYPMQFDLVSRAAQLIEDLIAHVDVQCGMYTELAERLEDLAKARKRVAKLLASDDFAPPPQVIEAGAALQQLSE